MHQESSTDNNNIDNLIDNFNYDDFLIDIEPLQQEQDEKRHNSVDTNNDSTPVSSCKDSIEDDICIKMINDDVISTTSSSNNSTTGSSSNGNNNTNTNVDLNMLYNLKLEPSNENNIQIDYNDLFAQKHLNG